MCPRVVCEAEVQYTRYTPPKPFAELPASHSISVSPLLMINQHHGRALYRNVVHHAETGQILEPSGICCRAFSSASNQTRKKPSRAQDFSSVAKFANLGKGQGIPRPVGIGSGMGVGMAGKPTARGCGVPREPTSDSRPLLPASQSSQSQSKSSPVPFPAPFLD